VYAARDRMDPATETIRAVRDTAFKYIKNYRPDEPWVKFLPYRDQMELMQELLRIGNENEANLPVAQQWFVAQRKPKEELYDTRTDPYEINNLADDVRYAAKLEELRSAHETWSEQTHDLGHIPETALIKQLWPPDGIQPVTAQPQGVLAGKRGRNALVALQCTTEGASIAYRTDPAAGSLLYTDPVELPPGAAIYARAIRIGYKESG